LREEKELEKKEARKTKARNVILSFLPSTQSLDPQDSCI